MIKSLRKPMTLIITGLLLFGFSIVSENRVLAQDAVKKQVKEPITPVFVSISTDDLLDADAAVHFVEQAAKRGHEISILLNSRGTRLALDTVAKPIYGKQNKSIQDRLKTLIKKGVKVMVCFGHSAYDGRKKVDLIDGVIIGNADLVMLAFFEKNTKTISW